MIVKKDGRREPFDREKIRNGIIKACEKRPVAVEVIDRTVESIERRLHELCEKEVSSRLAGDLLMEHLKEIDQIAYVRFASVYREFSDVSQFVDTLQSLDTDRPDTPESGGATVVALTPPRRANGD
jgi:transcriptional repressor NrdR